MIGELLCPDCGGVVGATETTEAGPPCKCFASSASSKYEHSETVTDVAVPTEETPVAKICRICGKDVAGKKRVKDSQGYYCYECAKEEEKKEHGGRIRCRVCGHLTKEEALITYEGTRMCPRCNQERIDLQKQQIKHLGITGARTRAEISQIYTLLYIGGGLLLIIIFSTIYVMHRRH